MVLVRENYTPLYEKIINLRRVLIMMNNENINFLKAWSKAEEAIKMMNKYRDNDEAKYSEWEKVYYDQMAITKAVIRKQYLKAQK
jgi:pantothenate kinase-related protein Tda10